MSRRHEKPGLPFTCHRMDIRRGPKRQPMDAKTWLGVIACVWTAGSMITLAVLRWVL